MFAALVDYARLLRAAFVLSRQDALIPREYAKYLPGTLQAIGSISRIGARRGDRRVGERLAAGFEKLGPAYVKLGQFMATRPDIIGFELASDLARLQDKMPPFPEAEARAEIEKAFGKSIDELFADFSKPIAAASIAQAHKATLKDGREVAVKILRPDIELIATREFRAFGRAARLAQSLSRTARRMEPEKFIDTLKAAAAIELDLRLEAGAASEMQENLRGDAHIRIPDIIWDLSAKRVLTVEWIEGTPLGDLAAVDARGIDRKALAKIIMRNFLTQALHIGFFHADMHQGNMIIDKQGRLGLIDFGIMGRLDEPTRRTFAEIIFGFISRDYRRTAEVHFNAGYVPPGYNIDDFAQAMRAVGEPLQGRNAAGVDMSRVLQQLFDVTAMFDMHLRPELVLLQRTMVTVEGVARVLDPEIDMWETATPVVKEYVQGSIGAKAQTDKLRDATRKALDIAPKLPLYIEEFGKAAHLIAEHGLPQAPEPKRNNNAAIWFVGIAVLALAFVLAAG